MGVAGEAVLSGVMGNSMSLLLLSVDAGVVAVVFVFLGRWCVCACLWLC